MRFGVGNTLISDLVNRDWVHRFMCRRGIVLRHQTGKLHVSAEKQAWIEKHVAYLLGCVAQDMLSDALDEQYIENADETHFMVNMDDGKTLGFRGDDQVKYTDVVFGGEGMTMIVRISGGPNAFIETPFLIFKNANCSYPIRRLENNVPGVCYRTGPKGWIDERDFKDCVKEPKALPHLPNNNKTVLFMENCSIHIMNAELGEALKKSNTELRHFPANAAD